jgi:hypothetical protein
LKNLEKINKQNLKKKTLRTQTNQKSICHLEPKAKIFELLYARSWLTTEYSVGRLRIF